MAASQHKKKRTIAWKRISIVLLIPVAVAVAVIKLPDAFHKRKPIDNVLVSDLTAREVKALRRYNNEYHLEAARTKGIDRSFKNKKQLLDDKYSYIVKYGLRELHDSKYYKIPTLTYSMPYLKKEAVDFIDELGRRFHRTLKELDVQDYRFQLSSILRTEADQRGLRKNNINATQNKSSHYYGMTFDIAQTCFYTTKSDDPIYSYALRNLLIRNLIELQDEGRCYVLLETQTKCIHITVR